MNAEPSNAANLDELMTGVVKELDGARWVIGDRWLYRQPGGCLEIGQMDSATYIGEDVNLIHVCDCDVDSFMTILNHFVKG